MIAYNQQHLLPQAIESVLMQKTDFEFDVVLGDDCSTDRTLSVANQYAAMHPDRIKVLARPVNMGLVGNFADTYDSCTGQYIAVLGGDDYWTDPLKLQRQVDFLDRNSESSMCHHAVELLFETETTNFQNVYKQPSDTFTTFEELLKQNFIAANSVVFRRESLGKLPIWFRQLKFEDWALYLLLASQGKIGYLPDEMSVYRVHENATWSVQNLGFKLQAVIEMYDLINRHFDYKYDKLIRQHSARMSFELARHFARQGNPDALVENLKTSFSRDLFYPIVKRPKESARLLLKLMKLRTIADQH